MRVGGLLRSEDARDDARRAFVPVDGCIGARCCEQQQQQRCHRSTCDAACYRVAAMRFKRLQRSFNDERTSAHRPSSPSFTSSAAQSLSLDQTQGRLFSSGRSVLSIRIDDSGASGVRTLASQKPEKGLLALGWSGGLGASRGPQTCSVRCERQPVILSGKRGRRQAPSAAPPKFDSCAQNWGTRGTSRRKRGTR